MLSPIQSLEIRHPRGVNECHQRDLLLMQALRDQSYPFSIREEYPLLLSPDHTAQSYCVFHENQVIAHANLWHRQTVTTARSAFEQSIPISLIGNVATHPEWRGKGIMYQLFQFLQVQAINNNSAATILWSDLHSFYAKLGFVPFGQEKRFTLQRSKIPKPSDLGDYHYETSFNKVLPQNIIQLRPDICTLNRSSVEFKELLTIPWTAIRSLRDKHSRILSYLILGKGADMQGVIHEWGSKSTSDCTAILSFLFEECQFEKLMLLCPIAIDDAWTNFFEEISSEVQVHPMCLIKVLQKERLENLENLFIWGLDSI